MRRTISLCLSLWLTPTACMRLTPPNKQGGASGIAIADLATWESRMTSSAKILCDILRDPNTSSGIKIQSVYYDAQAFFMKVRSYTSNFMWEGCAQSARDLYRDVLVTPVSGAISGEWNFTDGLTEDAKRNSNPLSASVVHLLATKAEAANDNTPEADTIGYSMSVPVANAILAMLNDEKLGAARRDRLSLLVDHAMGHIQQWFVTKEAAEIRPVQVALTAQALIRYFEATEDPNVLPAIKLIADELWARFWMEDVRAFRSTDNAATSMADVDASLLIAPLYAWIYGQTGERKYLQRGDAIFSAGVKNAPLDSGRRIVQSYRWSFEYVAWRLSRAPSD